MTLPPFHLAFPVHDLEAARSFYGGLLGCLEGRSSDQWVDFDFFGHQIVAHLDPAMQARSHHNEVDGEHVPVPHFGAVLGMAEWRLLADRLEAEGTDFVIAPTVRFAGERGEQATMFFRDPSGNALEIKAMADPANLFARHWHTLKMTLGAHPRNIGPRAGASQHHGAGYDPTPQP